jgi:mannose-1-phosphate guanylyltransferase
MKLVLLSGGSGKRLWPLSNDSRSKQFLKVLDSSSGTRVSMVQRVYEQLESVGLAEHAIIGTSKSQVEMINSQLGHKIPVVIEPERRDTFPAIALSAVYLYSEMGVSLDEVISVLPVDPYVEKDFFETVNKLEATVQDSSADLALMGVKPTYPSSKYGYIIPDNKNHKTGYFNVESFKEKPTPEIAEELIKNNGLWNCGVFAFKLKFIIDILEKLEITTNYKELQKNYHLLPKNSFDYEVVEKANNIVAIPYDGYWKDLGTWNTLTEEMTSNVIGKGTMSEDSKDSHLVNELEIPVTLLGVSNLVVAASPDGILVSDKDSSPRLKDYIGGYSNRPMFEERRWGSYKVLDYTKYGENEEVLTKRLLIKSGKNLSYQLHDKRTEVWTVLRGKGEIALDNKLSPLKAGDVIEIKEGVKHAVKAHTDLEIIEVQRGSELVEEDITRLFLEWREITEFCEVKSELKI